MSVKMVWSWAGRSRALARVLPLCGMVGIALAGMSQSAGAQTPPAPQTTTATYQDWLVRCASPEGQPKACEVAQTFQAQGGQGAIAQIALGRATKTDPMRLIVELPPGVRLPAGVTVQTSEKASPLTLAFQTCPRSCFAELELKPDQVQALRSASGPGVLTFEDGSRRKVQLPVSFNGFAAALDASQK
ncbi:invasion associated locus B family protein [Azorhizobium sp. AG788]|uniref:invasion associated locus B family protein n=1 Tax=Azorhizobium sp. AG788 TaxID=2183897 RepID=UPI00313A22C5